MASRRESSTEMNRFERRWPWLVGILLLALAVRLMWLGNEGCTRETGCFGWEVPEGLTVYLIFESGSVRGSKSARAGGEAPVHLAA